MSFQYQCPPPRNTGIRVGQGGFYTVCELIGQSGWYAFERINNDGSVSHWFINQDGQHNNYIFPKQQLEAHLQRLGVNNVIITPTEEAAPHTPLICRGGSRVLPFTEKLQYAFCVLEKVDGNSYRTWLPYITAWQLQKIVTGFRKPRPGGGGYLNLRDDDDHDPQPELYDHGRRHEYDNDDPTARWIRSWWPTAHNDDDTEHPTAHEAAPMFGAPDAADDLVEDEAGHASGIDDGDNEDEHPTADEANPDDEAADADDDLVEDDGGHAPGVESSDDDEEVEKQQVEADEVIKHDMWKVPGKVWARPAPAPPPAPAQKPSQKPKKRSVYEQNKIDEREAKLKPLRDDLKREPDHPAFMPRQLADASGPRLKAGETYKHREDANAAGAEYLEFLRCRRRK